MLIRNLRVRTPGWRLQFGFASGPDFDDNKDYYKILGIPKNAS